MPAIQVGPQTAPLFEPGQSVTLVNSDLLNSIYVSTSRSVSVNDAAIPPLGSLAFDGTQQWYGSTGEDGVYVQAYLLAGASGWSPSPQQIAEQIALKGISVTVSGTVAIPATGDTTGTKDTSAWTAGLQNGGSITLVPGSTYYIEAGEITLSTGQYINGQGAFISAVGTGDVIRLVDTSTYDDRNPLGGGGILGFPAIDGTSAGAGSNGIHAGDIFQMRLDAAVQNFTGAGDTGVLFDNQYYQAEQMKARLYVSNCTQAVAFTSSNSGSANGSFDRGDTDIYLDLFNGQSGVLLEEGSGWFTGGGHLGIYGNITGGATAATVLELTGSGTNGDSQLSCQLEIDVEQDGAGPYPQTISFGGGSNIIAAYGRVAFTGSFTASDNSGQFSLLGRVSGDTTLQEDIGSSYTITDSGFPSGWTGKVKIEKVPVQDLVFVLVELTIASGTVVTNGDTICTFSAPFIPDVAQWFTATLITSSDTPVSMQINTSGDLNFRGSGFTASGEAFLSGSGTVSNSQ